MEINNQFIIFFETQMEGEYSFSLTTFSPSGKLVQIEYALARVASGATSLAIKGFFLDHFSPICLKILNLFFFFTKQQKMELF